MWAYVRQINNFTRIEDRSGEKPRVVCLTANEADAKLICQAVNASGLKVEMFATKQPTKPATPTKQAAG
jgi:hypothetical protein